MIVPNFFFEEFRFGLHADFIVLVDFLHVLGSIEGRFISATNTFKQTCVDVGRKSVRQWNASSFVCMDDILLNISNQLSCIYVCYPPNYFCISTMIWSLNCSGNPIRVHLWGLNDVFEELLGPLFRKQENTHYSRPSLHLNQSNS